MTGPSLTSSTLIRAPKTPVATGTPWPERAAQKRSTSGLRDLRAARRPRSRAGSPYVVSASSVNWLTTRISPPVSRTERSNFPSSLPKMRSRAILAGETVGLGRRVIRADTQEHEQSRPDLADGSLFDGDAGAADPLNDGAHTDSFARTNGRPHISLEPPEYARVIRLNKRRLRADRTKMEAVRKPRNQWPALGTLLVRDGAVTSEQLESALAVQRARPDQRLGEILLEKGFVTPTAISRVLAEQHELEFVDIDLESIEIEAALMLSESLARRYRALPIRFLDDGFMLVAVADPTNVMFSDELRLAVGMPIRICVAGPDRIDAAIDRLHDDAAVAIEEVVTRRPRERGCCERSRPEPRHSVRRLHQQVYLEGA